MSALITISVHVSAKNKENVLIITHVKQEQHLQEFSMAVLSTAYIEMGYQLKFLEAPGERALRLVNSGKADGEIFRIAGLSTTYKNLIQVSPPIFNLRHYAYTILTSDKTEFMENIEKWPLGFYRGYKFAEQRYPGPNSILVADGLHAFKLLLKRRVEVVIATQPMLRDAKSSLNLSAVKQIEPALATTAMYHYVHKRHALLVPELSDILRSLHVSGEISKLYGSENRLEKSVSAEE